MTPVEVQQGDGPVILGLPHTGTFVPDDIHARFEALIDGFPLLA